MKMNALKITKQPIVFIRIDGKVIQAECPICLDALGMGDAVGTAEEQEQKMNDAFERHKQHKHKE